jgi:hypothetical protein
MEEKRTGKDRRVNPERRKGGDTSYKGPEKREEKYRRLDIGRREKDLTD